MHSATRNNAEHPRIGVQRAQRRAQSKRVTEMQLSGAGARGAGAKSGAAGRFLYFPSYRSARGRARAHASPRELRSARARAMRPRRTMTLCAAAEARAPISYTCVWARAVLFLTLFTCARARVWACEYICEYAHAWVIASHVCIGKHTSDMVGK